MPWRLVPVDHAIVGWPIIPAKWPITPKPIERGQAVIFPLDSHGLLNHHGPTDRLNITWTVVRGTAQGFKRVVEGADGHKRSHGHNTKRATIKRSKKKTGPHQARGAESCG